MAKNPTAVVGFPQFKKENPAPQKEVVKDKNPITEKEYYEFLELDNENNKINNNSNTNNTTDNTNNDIYQSTSPTQFTTRTSL